jgi:hypothetical protein
VAEYTFKIQVVPPDLSSGIAGSWYRAEGRYLPGAVYLRIGYGPNGQLVCTGLLVDSPKGEITTSALRNIPINKLLSGIIDQFGLGDPMWKAIEDVELPPIGPSGFGKALDWDATPKVEKDRPQRGGGTPSKERLKQFADAYRYALNSTEYRHKPIAYAAAHVQPDGISVATAHRWRKVCQDKGLLDPPAK